MPVAQPQAQPPRAARARALVALALLTGVNLFNYLDRYILAPLIPQLRGALHISRTQAGSLVSAFFLVYMLASPPVGILADRLRRKWLVAGGIFLWSVATLMSGWASGYGMLLFSRALVGIGEASYACIVPALLSDLFPASSRSRALAVFYSAIPVGAALGYALGGWIGARWGWRDVFYVGGIPGLFLAFLLLSIQEPERGAADEPADTDAPARLHELLRNGAFITATLGMAFSTFALGALSVWMPSFLTQSRHLPMIRANLLFGVFTLVNGIGATLLGGWMGDRWLRRESGALYLLSAWSMLAGVPIAAIALFSRDPHVFLPAIFIAEFFLLFNGGPLNAAIVNSVPAAIRAGALGMNLVVIHLLGDAISPTLVGWVADRTHSLATGMALVLPGMLLAAAVLLLGARFAPRIAIPSGPISRL